MPRSSGATSSANRGTYVALLRGINVGGKNKLAMSALSAMFDEAGCAEVQTYIQSGNVVFCASAACAKRVPGVVSRQIAATFGLQVPVIVRSADEVRKVTCSNPFLQANEAPESLHVMFLADMPGKQAVAMLDPDRSPGDSFVVRGQEIYLHLPNGAGRSKLTNSYFDSRLKTVSTVRNWRTVTKLLEMTALS